jgi:Alw26I/Eco31I/Esp3I family type II restriction m6 adenine DNA methyltransferase
MSAPSPLEADYLEVANTFVNNAAAQLDGGSFEARLQLLEACAASLAGFNLTVFHSQFGVTPVAETKVLISMALPIVDAIENCPIHPALALSALGRESLDEANRKITGAYHTDFRLAQRLAELAAPHINHHSKVIDPACGAGILLVALTVAVCGNDGTKLTRWLANGVHAADLSHNSLRTTLLALASLTNDLPSLRIMRNRWICGDSLLAKPAVWSAMAPGGFDAVIGNPPWEKVKLSKHEFLKSIGTKRHYGSAATGIEEKMFSAQKDRVANYSQELLSRYPDLKAGEPDLYIAFTSLFFEICRPNGVITALVPGGLIRSQGTQAVREKLINASSSTSISIIDNRARFFAIDTRFKFLAISFVKSELNHNHAQITLLHERGTPLGLETFGSATIGHNELIAIREDLSLPEVKSQAEWQVFRKVTESGIQWNNPIAGWSAKFCREVDMTKERPHFLDHLSDSALPLIEGRMVHHHRFGVKGHATGSGRKAIWLANPIGASNLSPQFWIDLCHVAAANRSRVFTQRVGFCDIAGQTNERSLMAAIVPAGVVCGNKVPTIIFPDDPSKDRLLVWTAIANSFVFDWMLRRVLTTTVNYFLLQSIPLPRVARGSVAWKELDFCASELIELDTAGATKATYDRMAHLRARIDAVVALAYGLNISDFELMFTDFPILDRGQPALSGEFRSTVTRDTALAMAATRMGSTNNNWNKRAESARALGALAYVPSEVASADVKFEKIDEIENDGFLFEQKFSSADTLQGNRSWRSPQNACSI